MYFSACGAPKFALRSERAFEEIARAWRASLLWRAVYLSIWSPRRDTSEIHSSACGLFMRMPRHYPAVSYLDQCGMLLTVSVLRPPPALSPPRLTPNSARPCCLAMQDPLQFDHLSTTLQLQRTSFDD